MPIDFAQIETGEKFELLCEDLLRAMGFTIVEKVSRGADGGTDLIVAQPITDMMGFSEQRKTVVQCKHWAKGRKAIPFSEASGYREAMGEAKVHRHLLITSTFATIDLQRKSKAVTDKGDYVALIWSAATSPTPECAPATFPPRPNSLPPNPAASKSFSVTSPPANPPSATSTTDSVPRTRKLS